MIVAKKYIYIHSDHSLPIPKTSKFPFKRLNKDRILIIVIQRTPKNETISKFDDVTKYHLNSNV